LLDIADCAGEGASISVANGLEHGGIHEGGA
jgi:hypothetical protein